MKTDTVRSNLKIRGLTLIEVTIALALISLVIAMVFQFNDFGVKVFNRSQDQVKNQSDVRIPIELISKELRFADSVTILATVPSTHGTNEFYLQGGQIIHRRPGLETPVQGTSDVNDFTFTARRIAADILEIKVGKAGTSEYDVTTQVEVLNIGSSGITAPGGGSGIAIQFTQGAHMEQPPVVVSLRYTLLTETVAQYSVYHSPATVEVVLDDGSYDYAPVSWNGVIHPDVAGIETITGAVAGRDGSLTVTLTVTKTAAAQLPNTFTVQRSGNGVKIANGTPGATAYVLDAGGNTVKTGTLDGSGKTNISNCSSGTQVVLKMAGVGDSAPVPIP